MDKHQKLNKKKCAYSRTFKFAYYLQCVTKALKCQLYWVIRAMSSAEGGRLSTGILVPYDQSRGLFCVQFISQMSVNFSFIFLATITAPFVTHLPLFFNHVSVIICH